MISAISWVPKGASKVSPVEVEPPSIEEIEEILSTGALEKGGDSDVEEGEDMDVDASIEEDEVVHALAAAKALSNKADKSSSCFPDIADSLRELDMDHYDDEDDGIELFSTGLGNSYYPSNDMDPYLKNKDDDDDDEDDDEIEDMTIEPTDAVIVCARNEDEVSHLEVWIFEESEDGDSNMYVHHDIILADFPLCTAWLDCGRKGDEKGNFIAVGSMEPAIEIWDLDLVDEVQPFMVLGGVSRKKKTGKKTSVKYKKNSHRDSVLGLAWNKEVRNVLASASADKTVKIWDVVTGKCAVTVEHHKDKVQAVAWSRHSPEILISGSFDPSVAVMDMRSSSQVCNEWSVTSDVESLAWNPHSENTFVASLNDGTVQGFDIRALSDSSSSASSSSKPTFTLKAHDKTVTSICFNPAAPNFLATGSTDKTVKLWDVSNNQPSCIVSQKFKAGAIFSIAFSDDCPFLLAIGGSKGKLEVWDTLTEPKIANRYGKRGDGSNPAPSSD
ncbi:uncharacterized WD repeat-containing protein C17D11.16-like [Zingiber officinale]|uniref:uncharacterized WD repeat-containing protein C17D11.16-like n=1 Tax=Zingiber officinale TaxID=94328 RepID=UPI001C4AC5D3|nr:uncharacterized WD repeat-containing protein C17D11.16-like [Zingiber officinale]XP_042411552.1 uncharacterized WD repeat-containing protein C17D11.16-like [Zingiber officinale]XP_042411553.1 uncharacterized WD repeat-containing protein C17D11.16-like [Zingiber officinale]XP_042411554.1 uncharacterized WD repeat-containing protein C17D11.16-like [Zingiber officinale]XP_042411555.1 uncharacterized WD repeat-containing protein C17D11.16-like [Zingiber officinale]XP_042411556.1 uncharacterized